MHRIEEAEPKFKEIQNAYEVLSDPKERAWYGMLLVCTSDIT